MNRCAMCGNESLEHIEREETHTYAGHTFTAIVPAIQCARCGELYFDGPVLEALEMRVARALAETGAKGSAVFRLLRKILGLKSSEIAELFGVAPETVSRWENGQRDPDTSAFALLDALVIEASEGRTELLNRLRAFRTARPMEEPMRLGRVA